MIRGSRIVGARIVADMIGADVIGASAGASANGGGADAEATRGATATAAAASADAATWYVRIRNPPSETDRAEYAPFLNGRKAHRARDARIWPITRPAWILGGGGTLMLFKTRVGLCKVDGTFEIVAHRSEPAGTWRIYAHGTDGEVRIRSLFKAFEVSGG